MRYRTTKYIFNGLLIMGLGLSVACGGDDDDMLLLLPPDGGGGDAGGPGTSPDTAADEADSDEVEPEDTDLLDDIVEEPDETADDSSGGDDTSSGDDSTAGDDASSGDDTTAGDDTSSGDDTTAGDDTSSGDDTTGGDDSSSGDDTTAGDDSSSGDDTASGDTGDDTVADSGSETDGYEENKRCNARDVAVDTSRGKWYKDRGRGSAGPIGIHTFWRNQPLIVNVTDNCASGWYELEIKARNTHGPLPDFYDQFHVSVKDDSSGKMLGGIQIDADDSALRKGSLLVYVDGDTASFDLQWTNDAYEKDEYDANIMIHSVKLTPVRAPSRSDSLARGAADTCSVEGRWFWDEVAGTVRTYWRNQTLSFCYENLPAGQYALEVEARNYGAAGLPPGYTDFKVIASADGDTVQFTVPAQEDVFSTGAGTIDVTGGYTVLNISWLNDKYRKGDYDANIEIRNVRLTRVGDSERSALAASLAGAFQSGTGWLWLAIVGALALAGYIGIRRLQAARA